MCTCDGTVTGFGLANPKLFGEREEARQMLQAQPANRPAPGTAVVTDKGLSGEDFEEFLAGPDLGLALIRPARKDETEARYFPNWLRQRVEAIIWTLKNLWGSRTGPLWLTWAFYAARSYSLRRPPSTGRRLTRTWERSATG